MSQAQQPRGLTIFAISLILLGAGLRVARHYGWIDLPPNVAPVAAMAMFAAAYLPRRLAAVLPFSVMLISDALIGWYNPVVVASVYLCFAFSFFLGRKLRSHISVQNLVGASVLGSTVFFLVTNAAGWAFGTWYPHTIGGLMQEYTAGLPFFRNTLLGDLGYTAVIFGAYQLAVVYWRKWAVPAPSALYHG